MNPPAIVAHTCTSLCAVVENSSQRVPAPEGQPSTQLAFHGARIMPYLDPS